MVTRSAGLQTHIWNNNLKSLVLLGIYPLLIMGIVWVCSFAVYEFSGSNSQLIRHMQDHDVPTSFMGMDMSGMNGKSSSSSDLATYFIYSYWPAILAIVAIWFLISYFFHTSMIAKMAHAHPVTRTEEPELYNMLENLCIAEGMTMPKFNIIESHSLNAFASGINQKTFTITLTRGLMNRLSAEELEAVIAHELTHIKNRDVRLLMITIVFTGMVGLAAQMVWSTVRYNLYFGRSNRDQKGGGVMLLLAIVVILWIGYFATLIMRFALSRSREYMADAGAVRMTKNPEAMIKALMRISGRDQIPEATADIAFMCVENSKPFMGMFATHPPIEKRLKAISESTGTLIPDSLPPVSRKSLPKERSNPWLPSERPFRKNQKDKA